MGTLIVQSLTTAGLAATYTTAVAAGDEFPNDGHTLIHVKESAGLAKTITLASQVAPVPVGMQLANVTLEVTANGEAFSGFFNQAAYNDSSGMVQVSYSTNTGITIAAISVT